MKVRFDRVCCIIIISMFLSCEKKNEKEGLKNIFNPNLDVTVNSLIGDGYNKVDSLHILGKTFEDATINYFFLNDNDPVYSRVVYVWNMGDSLEIAEWIKSKGGIIYSDWQKGSENTRRFFIKGVKSGLIFRAFHRKKMLIIDFDFPDFKNHKRSLRRKIDENGVSISGIDNNGKEVLLNDPY
ncbi:MAG TPA: hypothetical protein VD908_14050 [Cytophagales bacterium]|nr:hypothetical protein [Cytophagales bacterium]